MGKPKGSEGQLEGSEGQAEGAEAQPAESEGQPGRANLGGTLTYRQNFPSFYKTLSPLAAGAQKQSERD